MSSPRGPGGQSATLTLVGIGVAALGLGGLWVAVSAATPAPGDGPVPANPITLVLELGSGARTWPGGRSTLVAAGLGVLALLALAVGFWVLLSRMTGASRIDAKARLLAPPGRLVGITPTDVARSAALLRPGADLTSPAAHGVPLGVTVRGKTPLRMDFEGVGVVLAGPRVGKSTSFAIPAIVDAPGVCVVTSNKADLHDATLGVRQKVGTTWVFDPQRLATTAGRDDWWVNILTPVTSTSSARTVAEYFSSATHGGAKPSSGDTYFPTEATNALAGYFLAAAVGGGDLLHVMGWLRTPEDPTPVQLLRQAGQYEGAEMAQALARLTPRQRDGVIGTARSWITVLTDAAYAAWVTPPVRVRFLDTNGHIHAETIPSTRTAVTEFSATEFVASATGGSGGDTLYALSKEGTASAGPLTTALVAQVFAAGEALAATAPTRRLATPMLFILDEVANVVRFRDLPDLYSHYGSRGMPILSFLQSWSQGVEVWGETGMTKLWSASNVAIYGGGARDDTFTTSLSNMIGTYDVQKWSTSRSRTGSTRSQSWTKEPILTVSELVALPRHRAIVLSSGNEATLIRTVPWMNGPHADAIKASTAANQPPSAAARPEQATTSARVTGALTADQVNAGARIATPHPTPGPRAPANGALPAGTGAVAGALPDPWATSATSAAPTDHSRGGTW